MTSTPKSAELSEGLYLARLERGSVLDLETESRHYRIEYLGGEQVRISGHPQLCPLPVIAQLKGSAQSTYDWGGFEPGFIGRGMHLIFRLADQRAPVSTSKIAEIRLLSPPHPPRDVPPGRESARGQWIGERVRIN
jgi:hypothetical protein